MMVLMCKAFNLYGGQAQNAIRQLLAEFTQRLYSTRKTRSKMKTAFAWIQRKRFNVDMESKKRCICKEPSYNAR
jgi:hypothetical protein